MDTLTFISSILASIAWPIAALLIVFLFRRSISNLLESVRLKRIKRGDFQIEFEQTLSQAKGKIEVASLPASEKSKPTKKLVEPGTERFLIDNEALSIANINPAAGIAVAWSQVERELQSTIERLGLSAGNRHEAPIKNVQVLRQYNFIDQKVYEALNDLRELRNKAVHPRFDTMLTVIEAQDFLQVAENVIRVLKSLKRK